MTCIWFYFAPLKFRVCRLGLTNTPLLPGGSVWRICGGAGRAGGAGAKTRSILWTYNCGRITGHRYNSLQPQCSRIPAAWCSWVLMLAWWTDQENDLWWVFLMCVLAGHPEDQSDFLLIPPHQELLGDRAKDCDITVSVENTGLEDKKQYTLSYVLFRCVWLKFRLVYFTVRSFIFTRCVSWFEGVLLQSFFKAAVWRRLSSTLYSSTRCSPVSNICALDVTWSENQCFSVPLPSTGDQSVSQEEPACVFCFFSLPNAGYLYSLKGGVELLSTYQYPEKVLEAVLTDHLLHVITKYVSSLISSVRSDWKCVKKQNTSGEKLR